MIDGLALCGSGLQKALSEPLIERDDPTGGKGPLGGLQRVRSPIKTSISYQKQVIREGFRAIIVYAELERVWDPNHEPSNGGDLTLCRVDSFLTCPFEDPAWVCSRGPSLAV